MKPEILEQYACPTCGKIYDNDYGAENCCPNKAKERFVCSLCKADFRDEAEEHILLPHNRTSVVTAAEVIRTVYLDLLVEGLPPIAAYESAKQEAEAEI